MTASTLPFAQLTELNAQREAATSRKPIGKLPWRILSHPTNRHAAILDADNNTLFIASVGIAEQILAAVNAHLALISKTAELELGLRCLHGGLHELDRTPRVRKMIQMTQRALGMADGGGGEDE